ncbi:MAG: MoaD/ThiS family protein [Chloroflexota bacterium]
MISLDVWLYGPLAAYAGSANQGSHANLSVQMADGATMGELLARLELPPGEKGLTFVNGNLTDTPGLGADLDRALCDGDRVAIFHRLSMWPFQYRFGAAVGTELKEAMEQRQDGGVFHTSA